MLKMTILSILHRFLKNQDGSTNAARSQNEQTTLSDYYHSYDTNLLRKRKQINIQWIMELYKAHPHKEKFFDSRLVTR